MIMQYLKDLPIYWGKPGYCDTHKNGWQQSILGTCNSCIKPCPHHEQWLQTPTRSLSVHRLTACVHRQTRKVLVLVVEEFHQITHRYYDIAARYTKFPMAPKDIDNIDASDQETSLSLHLQKDQWPRQQILCLIELYWEHLCSPPVLPSHTLNQPEKSDAL